MEFLEISHKVDPLSLKIPMSLLRMIPLPAKVFVSLPSSVVVPWCDDLLFPGTSSFVKFPFVYHVVWSGSDFLLSYKEFYSPESEFESDILVGGALEEGVG